MKARIRAAAGAAIISMALGGAVVMPATAGAHGNTGPLCYGNETYTLGYASPAGMISGDVLYYNEAFRIKQTVVGPDNQFYSLGHSAASYPRDWWVYTPHLRCF